MPTKRSGEGNNPVTAYLTMLDKEVLNFQRKGGHIFKFAKGFESIARQQYESGFVAYGVDGAYADSIIRLRDSGLNIGKNTELYFAYGVDELRAKTRGLIQLIEAVVGIEYPDHVSLSDHNFILDRLHRVFVIAESAFKHGKEYDDQLLPSAEDRRLMERNPTLSAKQAHRATQKPLHNADDIQAHFKNIILKELALQRCYLSSGYDLLSSFEIPTCADFNKENKLFEFILNTSYPLKKALDEYASPLKHCQSLMGKALELKVIKEDIREIYNPKSPLNHLTMITRLAHHFSPLKGMIQHNLKIIKCCLRDTRGVPYDPIMCEELSCCVNTLFLQTNIYITLRNLIKKLQRVRQTKIMKLELIKDLKARTVTQP